MARLAVPAVTVLLLVVAYVALDGWNRSAPPAQQLVVTERELSLPWTDQGAPGDDPGIQLRIELDYRGDPLDSRNWLPEDRLRALGFALDVPAGAPEAGATYRRALPRLGWVVLEYDGPAFADIERRQALTDPSRRGGGSRLVPVDAGPDFDRLRQSYATRHLIVRAVIGLGFLDARSGGPLVYGHIRSIVPSSVTVPPRLKPVVDGWRGRRRSADEPRYDAELASGPLGLLYLRDLRPRPAG